MNSMTQPIEVRGSFFDKPRKLYVEFLRNGILKECTIATQAINRFKQQHGNNLICRSGVRDITMLELFVQAAVDFARDAKSLSDIRSARTYFESVKRRFDEEFNSLFTALALIHGYNGN